MSDNTTPEPAPRLTRQEKLQLLLADTEPPPLPPALFGPTPEMEQRADEELRPGRGADRMSDDLVAFLRARLDEDEQAARACAGDGKWEARDIAVYGQDLSPEVRTHMARHDPARVLADVEAKREVLRLAARASDYHETFMNGFAAALGGVLRWYALPHADHPDYRDDWRP